jgi:hexosaminidase
MTSRNLLSSGILLFVFIVACKTGNEKHDAGPVTLDHIIPHPVSVTSSGSTFEMTEATSIVVAGGTEALKAGQYLSNQFKPATGFALPVMEGTDTSKAGQIYLTILGSNNQLGNEGYEMIITDAKVKITANKPAGLFYAIQTMRQLLPDNIESVARQAGPWKMATGTIVDYPNYQFRGSMLDVARHFFGVEDVKRYIDFLAFYKMNVFHLHLSDDQGWRIEIKSWPNLTAIGGSTQVGGGKGGFYTQEQYKDIVQYALDRHITIIPEIDMPGHTNAALASYPELNCNDSATKLYTGTEVGFSSLCTPKDITYKFIDDVIRELSSLTPGPYIHIGGDESHATKIEDYIPFVARVQEIVKKHGKLVIGWDEIALSAMQPNSAAQFWADSANSVTAVKKGAKIMMSPAKKAYLDMQYDSTTKLGLHWAGYIEVDSAYAWDPAAYVRGISKENILGVEAALWTETVTNMNEIEYMVFPRLPGYAEIGWSPASARNWEEYKVRLGKHGNRMKSMEIDFYKSKKVPWID